MFRKALTTINLISFFMGSIMHTPTEIAPDHGIYPQTMVVYDLEVDDKGTETVEDDDGVITLLDGVNHLWKVNEYPEDYWVGDYVAVIMDDNGTPNYIWDDVIIDMRATGFVQTVAQGK